MRRTAVQSLFSAPCACPDVLNTEGTEADNCDVL